MSAEVSSGNVILLIIFFSIREKKTIKKTKVDLNLKREAKIPREKKKELSICTIFKNQPLSSERKIIDIIKRRKWQCVLNISGVT